MIAQNLSQMRCAVSLRVWISAPLCARSTHDVHHAIVGLSTSSLVVLVVHCELHVVRVDPVVVCDDVVVRRTLVLIALCRNHCFRRSHFS